MKLSSVFNFKKVTFNQDTKAYLLLKAEAPKVALEQTRKPLNLVVALDTSSSMVGKPIEYVKKSALKLVEHLTPVDRLGVITFNHVVNAEFEPMLMTPENKEKLRQIINNIYSSGSTNFSGAVIQGLDWCKHLDSQCRFVILTDGQPTAGEVNLDRILALAKNNRTDNTTVTAFGYGEHHDETFLRSLAEQGKGNYSYIQNPDDALKAFALELGGLLSCFAQKVKFKVTPKDGVLIDKVVSDVDVKELGDGAVEITVADLYSEEVRNIVLNVTLPKQSKVHLRSVTLFDVSMDYVDVTSGESKQLSSKAQINFVKSEDADKDPIKDVMTQVAHAEIADAQKAADAKAASGDFAGARTILSVSTSNAFYADAGYNMHLNTLAKSYTGQADFASSAKYRAASGQTMKSNKFAGGMSAGTTNVAMDSLVSSFVDDSVDIGNVTITPTSIGMTTPQQTQQTLTINVDPNTLVEVKKSEEKKSGLSKTRSSDAW